LVQLVFRKSERVLGLVGLFGAGLFEPNGPTNVRRRTDGSRNWRATSAIKYFFFLADIADRKTNLRFACRQASCNIKYCAQHE